MHEPRLQSEPRGGVPDVIDTVEGFNDACDELAAASGSLAADAERASGFRYGHEDWLVQFKRDGAGIFLFDPIALTAARHRTVSGHHARQRAFRSRLVVQAAAA